MAKLNSRIRPYRIMALLFIAVVVWWGFFVLSSPSPKSANAPDTEFSVERAFRHVRAISEKPHPLGSGYHDEVRDYLVKTLSEMNLEPKVIDGIGVQHEHLAAARTQNIVAKLEGSQPERAILMMAHYDSRPYALGAADDGSGVAAILETVRAIQASGPLKNDIIILFTDGEELGLLGAELFADTYPQLEEIGLVLNLEARGSGGPSIMFETNRHNAALIPHFARATPNIFANSITYTVYQLLPNDTDFSVTKRAGLQGLNFAFIEDYLNYHTLQDSPGNLSLRSLQHHGENLLSNARYFGDRTFNLESDYDLVYFNNPFGGLTFYPAGWSLWLAVIVILLYLFTGIRQFLSNRVQMKNYFFSLILFLVLIGVIVLTTYFGWELLKELHPEYVWSQHGETYRHSWYLWGFISLTILVFTTSVSWMDKKFGTPNLVAGFLFIWTVLTLITAVYLPATAYLFTWPTLFGILGWLGTGSYLVEDRPVDGRALLLFMAGSFMALFIVPPYVKFIQVALTTGMLSASMFLVVLVLGMAWPLVKIVISGYRRYWYTVFVIVFVGCIGVASYQTGFDVNHKKQNALVYALDLDSGRAYWLSPDHTADSWTQQFLGQNPVRIQLPEWGLFGNTQLLHQTAEPLTLESPELTVLDDSLADSLRTMTLELHIPERYLSARLSFNNPESIQTVSIGLVEIFNKKNPLSPNQPPVFERVYYNDKMDEPVNLHFTAVTDTARIRLQMILLDYDFPREIMRQFDPRAAYMMPKPFGFSNGTVTRKIFLIE